MTLCFRYRSGLAFCDPDPALTAETLAPAGIIDKQPGVKHDIHKAFSGSEFVLFII